MTIEILRMCCRLAERDSTGVLDIKFPTYMVMVTDLKKRGPLKQKNIFASFTLSAVVRNSHFLANNNT